MTLLGLSDGDNESTGNGYLDIVDFIIQNCTDVNENLHELYRRVAFNICIGNSDDHFRNHGFLLTPKGRTLSPAYDINPTSNEYQSLLIDYSTNKSELSTLLKACENYIIKKEVANQIISEVTTAINEWKIMATKLGISNREMNPFSAILDNRIKEQNEIITLYLFANLACSQI